jgi:hypothetical protein
VSTLAISFFVGTARGQYTPPGAPRVQTPPIQSPRPSNPWQAEQVNRWWEESRENASRYPTYAPNVKGASRAINDAVGGMAVAMALGGGLIILLVGLFIFKCLRPPVYARNRALDDPHLRAVLADMAAQGRKAHAKAEQAPAGERMATEAKDTPADSCPTASS